MTSALHEHFAQGRLTRDESDERLTATLSAKTVGDLREATRDLPGHLTARPSDGHGPGEMGAAHWGRGSLAPTPWAWSRGAWGPPRRRPFGPMFHFPIGPRR